MLSLDSGQWELVLPTTTFASALFDTSSLRGPNGGSGRLLLVDDTAGLRAAPFDPGRPARTSADASVLDNVYSDISTESRGWLATSNNGTAVYAFGNPSKTSLVWVDREGKIEPVRQRAGRVSGSQHLAGRDESRRQARVSTSGFTTCSAGPTVP